MKPVLDIKVKDKARDRRATTVRLNGKEMSKREFLAYMQGYNDCLLAEKQLVKKNWSNTLKEV